MREKGLDVVAGNFAANITTEGSARPALPVGTHLTIGDTELVISQLGKICHNRCAIYHQAGDCVMPREGIFGIVLQGGPISVEDEIKITGKISESLAIIGTANTEKEDGQEIISKVQAKWNPTVIRFDIFNPAKNNLPALIKDLTTTQNVTRIVIIDKELHHGLNTNLFGDKNKDGSYTKESSTIYHITAIKELS